MHAHAAHVDGASREGGVAPDCVVELADVALRRIPALEKKLQLTLQSSADTSGGMGGREVGAAAWSDALREAWARMWLRSAASSVEGARSLKGSMRRERLDSALARLRSAQELLHEPNQRHEGAPATTARLYESAQCLTGYVMHLLKEDESAITALTLALESATDGAARRGTELAVAAHIVLLRSYRRLQMDERAELERQRVDGLLRQHGTKRARWKKLARAELR